MRLLTVVGLVVAAGACKTVVTGPDPETLKPAIEAFHRSARWKDFRGAADLIVPERRTPFIKARAKDNDEKDLFITDYQLEDAKISADTMTADVVTKMSWYRLPSVTEKTVTIVSIYAWRGGQWLLESQDEGPFPDLKPVEKPTDAGTSAADAGK